MVRLSRTETQERNRAKVLSAARDEFAGRGFRDAKIDVIAERAELTRGAVYSNFPGKRALYFAVLADLAERAPRFATPPPDASAADVLAAFARAWVARLPLATDDDSGDARLGRDLLPEILADEHTRRPFAQLMRVDAILLGLALERVRPGRRLVRVAEAALTTLHGASQLAAAAPGFGEPFHIVAACAALLDLDLTDDWPDVPPITSQARPLDEPWTPPTATDLLTGEPFRPGDGVVTILGLHRAAAFEEAVRTGADVTAVLVTSDPGELAPLARLAVADLRGCLDPAIAPPAQPRLRLVCDATGELAAAAGVTAVSDATETAVRVEGGRIVVRAEGFGACHAAAVDSGPGRSSGG
ncbi:TetR family transcriptional regulator [Amycolatopsis sp. NBRC 101858]|uniref:TetR/AcrR family transcriptional regulator n=1 Tax=Amycolatopsis sp. NBRC 101858 TaxID=3032200 RepID=UPI0024A5F82F|nr:TetR/AcrR family transcriptional regulator [Amycolatopsis sp. NBRC 101858]GLY36992.1 TetR family transcriptional regulator [Amycolatopsis sp. NBRC 101858]